MSRLGDRLGKDWKSIKNQAGVALAGIALFLLAFLAGLHLFFPTNAVQQWLTAEIGARTPFSLQSAQLSLQPVFTLSGKNVVLGLDKNPGQTLVLDELQIKPFWSSLLGGDPGITLEAILQQGGVDATLRRSGDLTLHTAGLKLTDFPVHRETGTLFSGIIVKGDLEGSLPARKGGETRLAVQIDNSALTLLGQPLPLGKIVVEGTGQGSSMRLTTLSASGGQILISGSGNLLLGTSAAASRISLDLSIRPTPSAPANLATLLDLAAPRQADGSYRLKLTGSLTRVSMEQTAPTRASGAQQFEQEE